MTARVLREARDDLRDAVRYYRNVKPPALGRQLAAKVLAAFREAVELVAEAPLARPEHPEIPGARYVVFKGFPYLVFYAVKETEVVVVAVEYATRDYVARITPRIVGAK